MIQPCKSKPKITVASPNRPNTYSISVPAPEPLALARASYWSQDWCKRGKGIADVDSGLLLQVQRTEGLVEIAQYFEPYPTSIGAFIRVS